MNVPASLPLALKAFAHRANQLRGVRPGIPIAYWCEYWVVQQIIAKQLHQTDDELLQYTTTLMDKLEQTKTEHADDLAIQNEEAGKEACVKFAQETFDRAERAVDANKVTRQTADTFQAAATFFELVNIWGQPDPETLAKIKYAKWNAARILKAIREGKDPNETNPRKKEEEPEQTLPPLDPNDPEVRMLMGSSAPQPRQPRPVSIEDVSDMGEPRPNSAGVSPLEPTAPVSAQTSPLRQSFVPAPNQVSPLAPPDQPAAGSYFPSMPTSTPPPLADNLLNLPSAPPPHPPKVPSQTGPRDFYNPTLPQQPTPPPVQGSAPHSQLTYSQSPSSVTPSQHVYYSQHAQQTPPSALQQQPYYNQPQRNSPSAPPAPTYDGNYQHPAPAQNFGYTTDDAKMALAQKHARWAISALNFEDVPTAVKELETALRQLRGP